MAYRTKHYSVYEQVLDGPSEQDVIAARKVLADAAKAREESIAGSIIACEECGDIASAKNWRLVNVWRDSASYYSRDRFIHRTELECPHCKFRSFYEFNRENAERLRGSIPTENEDDEEIY